jgi:hypothetical protein
MNRFALPVGQKTHQERNVVNFLRMCLITCLTKTSAMIATFPPSNLSPDMLNKRIEDHAPFGVRVWLSSPESKGRRLNHFFSLFRPASVSVGHSIELAEINIPHLATA